MIWLIPYASPDAASECFEDVAEALHTLSFDKRITRSRRLPTKGTSGEWNVSCARLQGKGELEGGIRHELLSGELNAKTCAVRAFLFFFFSFRLMFREEIGIRSMFKNCL